MARISTYAVDNNIVPEDKVLGTDAIGLGTKNYSFKGIVDWFNATGAVAINGQTNYFFQSILGVGGRLQGTLSFDLFGGVGTSFSLISGFKLAEEALPGYTLEDYLPMIVGNKIMLAQLDNLNNFGIYSVVSLTRDLVEVDFFNVVLTFEYGNGALEFDKFYGMSLYTVGMADKTYVYTQAVPSALWTINHNLGKYPAVTVVNINNVVLYGNTTYIDENNLQIDFSAGFSGKAYIN